MPAYFATDAAGAELIWDWGLGLKGKFDAAALAASVEFPWCVNFLDAGLVVIGSNSDSYIGMVV